jgi:hypothetical protein
MADFERIIGLQNEINQKLDDLVSAQIAADRITITSGLSELSSYMGLLTAGELRVGTGEVGDDYTGIRIRYPAMTYGSDDWHLVGVNSGTLQVGISATDGKLYAGGGTVVIDANGITIDGDAAIGIDSDWASFSATEVVINEAGGVGPEFRAESANYEYALWVNADLDTVEMRAPIVLVGATSGAVADFRTAAVVFNEAAGANTFRIETLNYAYAFYVGGDTVGIGTTAAGNVMEMSGGIISFNKSGNAGYDVVFHGEGANLSNLVTIDVDSAAGTLNMGYLGVAGNLMNAGVSTGFVWNVSSADIDFLVKVPNKTHMFFIDAGREAMSLGGSNSTPSFGVTVESTFGLKERAAGAGGVAGYGEIWVKNTTPTELWYTDDAGGLGLIWTPAATIASYGAAGGETVFNDGSADIDFRVESGNYTHMLWVNAGGDGVYIGGTTAGEVAIFAYSSPGVVFNESKHNRDFRIESQSYANMFLLDASESTIQFGTDTAGDIATFGYQSIVFNENSVDANFRVEGATDANLFVVDGGLDYVGIGLLTPNAKLTIEGTLKMKEQADAIADTAAYGQYWVHDDSPNNAVFTDDTGVDHQLTRPERYVTIMPFSWRDQEDCETGDGKGALHIPPDINGWNLTYCHAEVETAGTTGTMDIQLRNATQAQDMLSTKLTIDSGETGSDTAATAYAINTSNDDVATNDLIEADFDAVHTTAAKGCIITLGFTKP